MATFDRLLVVAVAISLGACTAGPDQPRTSVETERYPSGSVAVVREVRRLADGRSVPHGTTTTWYKNGDKRSEGRFVDGLAEGTYTVWDLGNRKTSETEFVAGKRQGGYRRWYLDGKLEREETYREDRLEGPAVTWHPNGAKRSEGSYVGGKKDGTWTYWDRHGELLRTESWRLGVKLAETPPGAPG